MGPADRGKAFQFLGTSFREFGGCFSPDGRWITYVSDESGPLEVYVRPFSGVPASAEGKVQISIGGGDFPVWRADGQELFFMAADFSVYAADMRPLARSGDVPSPVRLFRARPNTAPYLPPVTAQTYAYPTDTHDGETFLVNCRVNPAGRYVVLLNVLKSLR